MCVYDVYMINVYMMGCNGISCTAVASVAYQVTYTVYAYESVYMAMYVSMQLYEARECERVRAVS